jgi:hypothetical protein
MDCDGFTCLCEEMDLRSQRITLQKRESDNMTMGFAWDRSREEVREGKMRATRECQQYKKTIWSLLDLSLMIQVAMAVLHVRSTARCFGLLCLAVPFPTLRGK